MSKPEPTPEGALIRRVRLASGRRIAGCVAEMERRSFHFSVSRWSQIENGYEGSLEDPKPANAPPGTLAHMARVLRISPERLEKAGRRDAAEVLIEIMRIDEEAAAVAAFSDWQDSGPAKKRDEEPGNGTEHLA